MKNINYIGLLFLLFTTTTFAQQTEVKKDSIKLNIQLFPVHKQPAKMDIDGFILPDMNVSPSFKKPVIRPDSVTLRITTPELMNIPWPTPKLGTSSNPFMYDYDRSDVFRINYSSHLSTYSLQNTYPTMGTLIQAGAIYSYRPNERWELSGGIFSSKYTMPSFKHGSRVDFGFSGSAAYRINDFLRFRAYGEYSVNGENNASQGYMTPMYPQSNYGAILEIRLNDNVEIHGGVERSYDPMKGKWVTYPVLYPVIYLKRKNK